MASIFGFFFCGMSFVAGYNGESDVVIYAFGILSNIWWAAAYVARQRS